MNNAVHHTSADAPISIQGYVTDPKQVGYQHLTNYENFYWRPLVGNEAWGLYEVLRGHCRSDNSSCRPTLNTLMAILGIKDRRELTGRIKTVKGKEYRYPGWIEVLQSYELIIAEVLGEGPKMSYTFHVNQTPGLLSQTQLSQLPPIVQKKHQALIDRVERRKKEMRAKRRRPKVEVSGPSADERAQQQGMGKSQGGVGISHTYSGNFPPEQKQQNKTYKTTTTGAVGEGSPNAAEDAEPDKVVVALDELGFKPTDVKRLAKLAAKNNVDVLELIAFMQHKLKQDSESIPNIHGWLSAGIQRGYDLTAWREQKARAAAKKTQRQQQAQKQQAFTENMSAQRREEEAKRHKQEALLHTKLRQHYHTTSREDEIWDAVLNQLKTQLTAMQFSFLTQSQLLSLTNDSAIICIPNAFMIQKITESSSLQTAIQNALADQIGNCQTATLALIDLKSADALPDRQQSSIAP